LRYLGRRLGWAAILLLVLTLVTFVLSHVIPGDPATFMAGFGATKESIVAMRAEMGLDKPLPTQYLLYLQGLAHLDFGTSVRTGDAVSSDIAHFLPASLELAIISFTIYVLLAVPLGTLAASRRGRRLDGFLRTFSIAGSGVPVFWLAILLQEFFFAYLNWLPAGGRVAITAATPNTITGIYTIDSILTGNLELLGSAVVHLILPVATIMGLTLVISSGFILINLVTDLLYPILDPRLRES